MARILVVDDNADSLEPTAALFEAWGHDVRMAADGAAALSVARLEHAGIDQFLRKPLDPAFLRSLLGAHRSRP